MLEIRYNIFTKELTGWWGTRHGNEEAKLKNRLDEEIALIDSPIPDKPLGAWLLDNGKLIPNPKYVEPEPPWDVKAEIDDLKTRLAKLE